VLPFAPQQVKWLIAKKKLLNLKERVAQLEICYQVTSLLNSELNLTKLLDSIMEIARSVMKADACSLLLLDEETNELAPPAASLLFFKNREFL
jgi:transcriptional regulator with GAF, ATPase, and Fis domain